MIAPNQSPSARRFRKERDLSSSWTEPSPGICAWTLMASRPMTSSKAETACGGATHGPWVVVQRPQPGALNERLCLPRRTRSLSADTVFPICACSICWRNVNSSGETWLSSRAATSWPRQDPCVNGAYFRLSRTESSDGRGLSRSIHSPVTGWRSRTSALCRAKRPGRLSSSVPYRKSPATGQPSTERCTRI